jgi:transposase
MSKIETLPGQSDNRVSEDGAEQSSEDALNVTSAAEELSPKQQQVLVALVGGESVTLAAKLAGVDRTTVYRWLKNPTFAAERNRLSKERLDQLRAKAISLGETALETIQDVMTTAESPRARLEAAKMAIKITGLDKPARIGPTEAEEIERERQEHLALLPMLPGGDFC